MKILKQLFLIGVLTIIVFVNTFISCDNSSNENGNNGITEEPKSYTIYVAGRESNGNNDVAKVWKSNDGGLSWIANSITDGSKNASIDGMVIKNSILFVRVYEDSIRKVWKSSDYGINWQEIIISSEQWWSNTDFFTDGTALYVSASHEYEPGRWRGAIWKSIDDGENWTVITSEDIGGGAVVAVDSIIYAMGMDNNYDYKVYKSINGGETWTSSTALTNMTQTFPGGIHVDGLNIYITGSDYGASSDNNARVWISTDGGMNWITNTLTDDLIYSTSRRICINNSIIYTYGYKRVEENNITTIWKSDDNGLTWTESIENISISRFAAHGSSVYAVGNTNSKPVIYKTDNNGLTWTIYPITDGINNGSAGSILILE